MKLIVQIPCYNEEKTLPLVVNSIPRQIRGVDQVEILIIDDGSKDKTIQVAKKLGVDHIVRHMGNQGLAASFADGIYESLRLGADIIVNTDGDNQYPQAEIPKLIKPILEKRAELVIANRQTDKISHFSPTKKLLQWLGSAVVRKFSKTDVPDAVSGFRAYSKEAAMHMNIITDFSYCIETIIQARQKRLAIASVDVSTNAPTRNSRLFKSTAQHIKRSLGTIIRVYTMYQPMKVFMSLGGILFLFGLILGINFLYLFITDHSSGHIQSLILSAILLLAGFQVLMTGLVSDLISINRRLQESTLRRVKTIQLASHNISRIPPRRSKKKAKKINHKGGPLRDDAQQPVVNFSG
jgi:glycosyltransferase involved in cell wall biosynthesis